jgi:hypothetical protein
MARSPYKLVWMPAVLRAAGLKVVEVPGWQWRGHGEMSYPQGVLLHHTAGSSVGNMPSLDQVTRGRSDLAGPLCNLALGRDGTYYVVAAGKGWHAGIGSYNGIHDGNGRFIGIEAENTGYTRGPKAEKWPEVQMKAYEKGVLALLNYIHAPVKMAVGHREFALPVGRKVDPTFDMIKFRDALDRLTKESS